MPNPPRESPQKVEREQDCDDCDGRGWKWLLGCCGWQSYCTSNCVTSDCPTCGGTGKSAVRENE